MFTEPICTIRVDPEVKSRFSVSQLCKNYYGRSIDRSFLRHIILDIPLITHSLWTILRRRQLQKEALLKRNDEIELYEDVNQNEDE